MLKHISSGAEGSYLTVSNPQSHIHDSDYDSPRSNLGGTNYCPMSVSNGVLGLLYSSSTLRRFMTTRVDHGGTCGPSSALSTLYYS